MKDVSVSMAKAIGIMLMVYAHSTTPNFFHGIIGGFHMPLFFFFSGYCFKDKYLHNFRQFANKRIQGLYIPFVVWAGVFLLLHNFFYYINFYNDEYGHIYSGATSHPYTLIETIKKGLFVIFTLTKNEQLLGGYWFIHDLFYASFISYLIIRFIKNPYMGLVVSLTIALIMTLSHFEIPYFAIKGRCLLAVSFFLTGRMLKSKIQNFSILLLVVSIIGIIIGKLFVHKSMLSFTETTLIPYYLCAICSIIAVKYLCTSIKNIIIINVMKYIGDNTLTILTWHLLVFRLISLIIVFIYKLPIKMVGSHPVIGDFSDNGWWIVYFIAGISIPCVIAKLHKYNFFRLLHI